MIELTIKAQNQVPGMNPPEEAPNVVQYTMECMVFCLPPHSQTCCVVEVSMGRGNVKTTLGYLAGMPKHTPKLWFTRR